MGAQARGIALVELAVVVSILAILAAVALPAFGGLLERRHASAAMAALATRMQMARMAAITRRSQAILCPSHSGNACDGGSDWSAGWLLFLDRDGNQQPDGGDEVLVSEHAPGGTGLRLVGTPGRPHLRYLPDGRSAGSNLTVSVCDAEGTLLGAVVVSNMGRPRTLRPAGPAPCPH